MENIVLTQPPTKMTQDELFSLRCKLDVLYSTNPDLHKEVWCSLSENEKYQFIMYTDFQRFTDPNYSYAAEVVGAVTAGMVPHHWRQKHGLDSTDTNGEGKPFKMWEDDTNKANGGFGFADCSVDKVEMLVNSNVSINLPVFIQGKLLVNIIIPMGNENIRQHLLNKISKIKEKIAIDSKPRRTNINVCLSVYKNNPDIKLVYVSPEFENYKHRFCRNFYDLIRRLK
jgi:hypothetical protein